MNAAATKTTTAPAQTPAPDQVDELTAARQATAKAGAAVEAAQQQLADAQATAERLQVERGDDVLAGRLTLPEAGAQLAAAMATIDAAKRVFAAAQRQLADAVTAEIATLARLRGSEAAALQKRVDAQRERIRLQAVADEAADGFIAYQWTYYDPPALAGLYSEAAFAAADAQQRAGRRPRS